MILFKVGHHISQSTLLKNKHMRKNSKVSNSWLVGDQYTKNVIIRSVQWTEDMKRAYI